MGAKGGVEYSFNKRCNLGLDVLLLAAVEEEVGWLDGWVDVKHCFMDCLQQSIKRKITIAFNII
jgi:hypothetical protein